MSLKAILFNFNGIIIKDDLIHQQLIDELLLAENLSPSGLQYQQFCLGKSDRIGLRELLKVRGRVVTEEYLDKLIDKKAKAYLEAMAKIEEIPVIEEVVEFILQTQTRHLPLGIVAGVLKQEVEYILERINLQQYFSVIIGCNEVPTTKPEPDGYLLAIEQLNQLHPQLYLSPSECLAIENTPVGISAAKNAGIEVVGVANTYPFHMLQRQANWCVDHLLELDLDWITQTLTPV